VEFHLSLSVADLSAFVLFAGKQVISRISLDTADLTDVVVPVTGLESVVALDWHSTTDHIYWTDVIDDSISTAQWDGTGQQVLVVVGRFVDMVVTRLLLTVTDCIS